ncbi:MAG: ribonuclease III, partial [Candidatus Dormibacteria bacterium]
MQLRLQLTFKRRELLREALTHTSWINERGASGRDNERLEYLGDAVLELVAGEYLFNRFPNYDEGQLTQMRSSLVSTVALAAIGEQLRLGEALRLGRGAAKSGARRLTSLHANVFEALIGAVFLDQGYRKAGRLFLSRIGDLSSWSDPNFKGRLQALVQDRFGSPPQYRTVAAEGGPRTRQYLSQVSAEGQPVLGEGRGGTKQAAEQAAARAAVDQLVAPASKKRRGRTRRGTAAAAIPALTEPVVIPPAAEPVPELPQTSRRRRRRSPGPAPAAEAAPVAATASPSGLAEPVGGGAVAVTGDAAGRRRRRRSRGSGSRTAAADETTFQPPVLEPAPAGAAVTSSEEVSPEAAAPRRRRRRRSRGGTATGAEQASAVTVEVAPPPADPSAEPPLAPRTRRRRPRATPAVALYLIEFCEST